MRFSLLTHLLLFATLLGCSLALTEDEKWTLDRFFSDFTNLSQMTPPWTSDSSQACIPPGFYGLECSQDRQHIIGLYGELLLEI